MQPKVVIFLAVALVGIALDQATKYWVRTSEAINNGGIDVIPHALQLVHAENPGAAFGMLGSLPTAARLGVFGLFTLVAVGVIVDLFRRLPPKDVFLSTTLGLILSGALGNGIDRLHKSTVTDFIRFYTDNEGWVTWLEAKIGMAEYPSFNVADINLVIGVVLFMVHYLFLEDRSADKATPREDDPAALAETTGGDADDGAPPDDTSDEPTAHTA